MFRRTTCEDAVVVGKQVSLHTQLTTLSQQYLVDSIPKQVHPQEEHLVTWVFIFTIVGCHSSFIYTSSLFFNHFETGSSNPYFDSSALYTSPQGSQLPFPSYTPDVLLHAYAGLGTSRRYAIVGGIFVLCVAFLLTCICKFYYCTPSFGGSQLPC